MAKFLYLGKYSAQGAAAVMNEGLTARKKAVEAYGEASGLKVLGWWAVGEADWDFAILSEGDLPAARSAAQNFLAMASGAFERAAYYTLVETEEVDDARATLQGYRAPGR